MRLRLNSAWMWTPIIVGLSWGKLVKCSKGRQYWGVQTNRGTEWTFCMIPSSLYSPLIRPPDGDQSSSVAQSCPALCDPMDCSTPGFPVHHQLPELAQTHVHWGDAIQPSHPLSSLLLLPSIFPSIRVVSNESVLRIRWLKYWRFKFSISPSNEYSGLISYRIDRFDAFAVQGIFKSLL